MESFGENNGLKQQSQITAFGGEALCPRELAEEREFAILAPYAAKSKDAVRSKEEPSCPFRTNFQRDRDRIIHSKAFRRLAYKTQVFMNPNGDHYRTRLTHTLEVSQVARSLAHALNLNEDLTEAIALAHDLGHTPFGHSGERVLNRLRPSGFTHQAQSIRVVDRLEKDGKGLNLTTAVRDGIVKHSKGRGPIFIEGPSAPATSEGFLVRVSDIIAYLAHDLDDAIRAGILAPQGIPKRLAAVFGPRSSTRIGVMVGDLLANSQGSGSELQLKFSPAMEESIGELRTFLHREVYQHPQLVSHLWKADKIVESFYKYFLKNYDQLPEFYPPAAGETETPEQVVCDFIAGMTDRYALDLFQQLFWPE